jgi:hypothetical protein
MTWATRRVTRPLVVEPEHQSIVGSVWVRREITDADDPFNEVRLTGCFDLGNDSGGIEACITSNREFTGTYTITADDLVQSLSDLLARAAAL